MSDAFTEVTDAVDGTRWRFDSGFLRSNWRCRWGDGCQGIGAEPAPELAQGCCSVGAELLDEDEAMRVAALGATLDPALFQHHDVALFRDDARTHTAVVDGACVFFNDVDFAGGAGCALHLGAEADGESPINWKPSVCWQLPLKVAHDDDGVATLRSWSRADWGPGGQTMAWCCTEEPDCYDGDRPVIESLGAEIEALVGRDVYVELRARLS